MLTYPRCGSFKVADLPSYSVTPSIAIFCCVNTIFFRNAVYPFYQLPDLVVEPFVERQPIMYLPPFYEHPTRLGIDTFHANFKLMNENEEPTLYLLLSRFKLVDAGMEPDVPFVEWSHIADLIGAFICCVPNPDTLAPGRQGRDCSD